MSGSKTQIGDEGVDSTRPSSMLKPILSKVDKQGNQISLMRKDILDIKEEIKSCLEKHGNSNLEVN